MASQVSFESVVTVSLWLQEVCTCNDGVRHLVCKEITEANDQTAARSLYQDDLPIPHSFQPKLHTVTLASATSVVDFGDEVQIMTDPLPACIESRRQTQ